MTGMAGILNSGEVAWERELEVWGDIHLPGVQASGRTMEDSVERRSTRRTCSTCSLAAVALAWVVWDRVSGGERMGHRVSSTV